MSIPALTLTQPWATLVAVRAKRYETRSWGTTYRGPLAIHAAKGWTAADRELCNTSPFAECLSDYAIHNSLGDWGVNPDALPRGVVLCLVNLTDCQRIWDWGRPGIRDGDLVAGSLPTEERALGNYASGRYAWKLDDVCQLERPVPAKGALGLWHWEPPAGLTLPLVGVKPPMCTCGAPATHLVVSRKGTLWWFAELPMPGQPVSLCECCAQTECDERNARMSRKELPLCMK